MSTYEGLEVHSMNRGQAGLGAQRKRESLGWAGDFLEETSGRILRVSSTTEIEDRPQEVPSPALGGASEKTTREDPEIQWPGPRIRRWRGWQCIQGRLPGGGAASGCFVAGKKMEMDRVGESGERQRCGRESSVPVCPLSLREEGGG